MVSDPPQRSYPVKFTTTGRQFCDRLAVGRDSGDPALALGALMAGYDGGLPGIWLMGQLNAAGPLASLVDLRYAPIS